jgi:hypothetical protein
MPFEAGQPRPEKAGRKPGSLNKTNQEVHELAEEFGITPMRVKYLLMLKKFKELGYKETEIEQLSIQEVIDIQSKNAADVAPYMYGKRKLIDSDGNDSRDPLVDLLEIIDANRA